MSFVLRENILRYCSVIKDKYSRCVDLLSSKKPEFFSNSLAASADFSNFFATSSLSYLASEMEIELLMKKTCIEVAVSDL